MTKPKTDYEKAVAAVVKLPKRFFAKVERDDATGCLNWTGERNSRGGYGRFMLEGKHEVAHRVAWFLAGNDLPPGLQLDHLCRNTRCVNIDHLELVTCQENIRRGWAARRAAGATA